MKQEKDGLFKAASADTQDSIHGPQRGLCPSPFFLQKHPLGGSLKGHSPAADV